MSFRIPLNRFSSYLASILAVSLIASRVDRSTAKMVSAATNVRSTMPIPRTNSDCGSFSFISTRKIDGVFNDPRRERRILHLLHCCSVRNEAIFHLGISVASSVGYVVGIVVPAISETKRAASRKCPSSTMLRQVLS